MGNLLINGTAVSEREFKEVEELFAGTRFPVGEIFKDGNVERAEIETFLDFDQNGLVSGDDFRLLRYPSFPHFIFGNLVSMLAKNGFDIDQRIAEHISDGSAPARAVLESRELMLAEVEKDPAVLIYSPSLRADSSFMLQAISRNKAASEYMDVGLTDDPDFILDAIKIDKHAFFWASDRVRRDVNFISRLLEEHENDWLTIANIAMSPETALLVAERKMYYDHYVIRNERTCLYGAASVFQKGSPFHYDDIDSMAKLCLIDFHYMNCISSDSRPRVWAAMMSELKHRGIEFPEDMKADFDTFRRVLRERYDISQIDRFRSLATLHAVMKNRFQDDPNDTRPVALWVASKDDHNGAFKNVPIADMLAMGKKFRVYYYEVETVADAGHIEKEVLRNGRSLHTLVLSGHGMMNSMQLGKLEEGSFIGKIPIVGGIANAILAKKNAKYFLDVEDISTGKFGELLRAVVPEGQVLLWSCSNGEGGAMADNMTNAVAGQVASGVSVYSPMADVSDAFIKFDGLKMKIEYMIGERGSQSGRMPIPAYDVTTSQ